MLIPAALGLPFFVMFGDQRIGRELFFATAVLAAGVLVAKHLGGMPILEEHSGQGVYYLIGGVAATMCAGLIVRTRGFFTKCWPALVAGVLCILGMLPHIYLPLASMTNPPMNWGYARTVEGFIHVLNRGQYEHFNATGSVGRLLQQLIQYGEVSADNVG